MESFGYNCISCVCHSALVIVFNHTLTEKKNLGNGIAEAPNPQQTHTKKKTNRHQKQYARDETRVQANISLNDHLKTTTRNATENAKSNTTLKSLQRSKCLKNGPECPGIAARNDIGE